MSQDPLQLPPPPDPATVAQWAGQIRTVIALLGGIGIGGAWLQHVTDAQISNDVTAVLTVGGLILWAMAGIWSWWQKREAAKANHASSVASAVASAHATMKAGAPTPLTVVPSDLPGIAPIATSVSPIEAATVPLPDPAVAPQPAAKDKGP